MTSKITGLHVYAGAMLGQVVTLAEAEKFWGKSRTAIMNQVYQGNLNARKALTGGSYLIEVKSMIAIYGQPDDLTLWSLRFDGK